MRNAFLLLMTLGCAPLAARADGMVVGLATAVSPSLYRDQLNPVVPFPYVEYRGERLFISGPTLGVKLAGGERFGVDALIEAHFMRFDPREATDAALTVLDEREFGTLGGVQLEYRPSRQNAWTLKLLADLTDHHGAVLPSLAWQHVFAFGGERTRYLMFAALGALPDGYTSYYFGVSPAESARGGPASYAPGSSAMADLGVGVARQLAGPWQAMAVVGARRYGDAVAESPLVEHGTAPFGLIGIGYRF